MGAMPMVVLAADDQPVSFRAQGLPPPSRVDAPALAARAVLRAFLEQHPNYQIEPFVMPSIGGDQMDSGPLMAIAAGFPPHAIYVNFRQSSSYIAHDFLSPLEILLARLNSTDPRTRKTDDSGKWLADPSDAEVSTALAAIKSRVPSAAWEVIYRQTDSALYPGKHVWALPRANQVIALVYRRDLFQKAGLDPSRPPETWDELYEHARRLTDPEKGQYGFMFPSGTNTSWGMYSLLVSNGGRMVAMQDGNWRAAYDTFEAAEAVLFFRKLIKQPFTRDGKIIKGCALLNTDAGDWYRPWVQGRVGMMFEYLSDEMAGSANPQLIGIAPVPKSPKGIRGSELNCPMLGVFSKATPQQQLAVMRYIWFVTSDEAKRIRTRVYVENGFGNFVAPDLLRQFGYQELLKQSPKGWQEAFDAALSGGVPEPYGGNTQNIYRWMSQPINAALALPLDNVPTEQAVQQIRSLLRESATEVNLKLMGQLSEGQRRIRDWTASAAMVLLVIVFAIAMRRSWRQFGRRAAEGTAYRRGRLTAMLVLPALLMILLWQYLPLAGGLGIALSKFELVRESDFAGVENFAAALFDERFWASLLRTFYFVLLTIGLGFWPPILLAILLQEVPGSIARYVFRTIYFLPAVISGVIIMFLWAQLYQPNEHGVLNRLLLSLNALGAIPATLIKLVGVGLWLSLIATLAAVAFRMTELSRLARASAAAASIAFLLAGFYLIRINGIGAIFGPFHIEPLQWTQSPALAMFCVVLPSVWAGAGPGSILYLAALKTIPDSMYEAADIDGASHLHKIVYIVLPQLKYLLAIQFLTAVIGAFRGGTDYILALTGGGPNDATTVLPLEIFTRTFMDLQFGIGTAMSWLLAALLVGFTVYQLRMLSTAEFKAGGSN